MTMPSERRRALRWGRSTLEDIGIDPGVAAELKEEVDAVLAAFPDDRAIATCFLEQDDEKLARQLVALEAAQDILWRAGRCPELSERTRFAAQATDRHFPQRWELSQAPGPRSPRNWVEFYLLRDMDAETMQRELLELGITDIDAACARLAQLGPPRALGRLVQSIRPAGSS
jgi:hypothetical protein